MRLGRVEHLGKAVLGKVGQALVIWLIGYSTVKRPIGCLVAKYSILSLLFFPSFACVTDVAFR